MSQSYHIGLLGHDISYSKSADIYQTIFRVLGVDGVFELFDVARHELDATFRNLESSDLTGLAVTIPHKQAVMTLLARIDPTARAVGAVNSIAFTADGTVGYNTDVDGFAATLAPCPGCRAVILGSGGAARAVCLALATRLSFGTINIVSRNREAATGIVRDLADYLKGVELQVASWDRLSDLIAERPEVTVNCTPIGGFNDPDSSPLPDGTRFGRMNLYYDLNYNTPNRAVEQALKSGADTTSGEAMLVRQALRSFELWTGHSAPFRTVCDAVFGES